MSETQALTPIRIDIPASQDALARLDEGVGQPGDELMALQYDEFCQQEWERHQQKWDERDRAAWLETQCPGCHTGGAGEVCDEHADDEEEEECE